MKILFNLNTAVKPHQAAALIKGVVTKLGQPLSCRVHAYNRSNGDRLSSATSKLDGSYVLFGSSCTPNYVIAIDPAGQYNLAVQDNVK